MSQPITGHFEADFGKFSDAVSQVVVKLKSFEEDAGKVERSLNRMTDNFSGRKVIQDAELMQQAVERIGGTSVLTEKELARLGSVAGEAVEKMKLMGIDVPPGLQKIADDTRVVTKEHSSLRDTVKDVALGFAAMFTVQKAVQFVSEVVNEASALKDLSTQTHINVEELQLLAGSMSEFGVDADSLGKGLFTLSRKVAGGDDSVARALHVMGMSLEEVNGLEGEALFLKMEHGLSTLQGSLRDTTASDLFGSKLGMAMAGASEGIDGTLDKARALNTVMSSEAVDALDQYGEAIERANRSLHSIAANMMGPVAEGFNFISDAVGNGASKWDIFVAMTKDWAASNSVTGPSTANLTRLLDDLNQKTEAAAKATRDAAGASREHATALTAEQQAARFMATIQADSSLALTRTQVEQLGHLKELGQLNAANAQAIGVNGAQFDKYQVAAQKATEELKKHEAELAKFTDATNEVKSAGDGWIGTLASIDGAVAQEARRLLEAGVSQAALAEYYGLTATQIKSVATSITEEAAAFKKEQVEILATTKLWSDYNTLRISHGSTATQQAIAEITAWADTTAAEAEKAGTATSEFYDALATLTTEKMRGVAVDWTAINATMTTQTKAGLQDVADKAAATFEEAKRHAGEWSESTIQKYRDTADAAQRAADAFGTGFQVNSDKASAALDRTVAKVKEAASAIAGVFAGDAVPTAESLNAAALRPGSMLGFSAGPMIQSILPFLSSTGWPGRADGGPVRAGESYMVGERGPELFTPTGSGSITPNGGGATVYNTFHIVDTEANLARRISDSIKHSILSSRRVSL